MTFKVKDAPKPSAFCRRDAIEHGGCGRPATRQHESQITQMAACESIARQRTKCATMGLAGKVGSRIASSQAENDRLPDLLLLLLPRLGCWAPCPSWSSGCDTMYKKVSQSLRGKLGGFFAAWLSLCLSISTAGSCQLRSLDRSDGATGDGRQAANGS
ncbi:hypothetical protein BGZ61DRAFT_514137 [Ilyonectria robusta]|uniref:uncharacterized protein n=1 Tax=Ilyonectria robusta TaxID=1079257 RepID=UPI001E8ED61A|nr:uncharacterized protein BGZ61DRAFT_514137 [Ilyonectria robusta]KAH8734735.1 hypothetical protein BGZ61DRAFT_514137 [Ilyonectria robusta]